jgi:hypothetical protein
MVDPSRCELTQSVVETAANSLFDANINDSRLRAALRHNIDMQLEAFNQVKARRAGPESCLGRVSLDAAGEAQILCAVDDCPLKASGKAKS